MQTQDRIIASASSANTLETVGGNPLPSEKVVGEKGDKMSRAASGTLFVNRLVLTNYRNYSSCTLALVSNDQPAQMIVLTGANGSGKTNLLEAVSYLSAGRGLRSAKLGDVTTLSKSGENLAWAVAADIDGVDGNVKLGTGLEPRPAQSHNGFDDEGHNGSERRVVRIDGNTESGPQALSTHMSVSWITPRMDRLFLEGTTIRRRFFDRLVAGLHASHSRQVSAYERAMRERMKLLTDSRGSADPDWLNALEKRAAEFGVTVAASRLDTLGHLRHQINEQTTSAFPVADVALEGHLEDWLSSDPAVVVEDRFREELAKNRQQDARMGRASFGPHKTDFTAFHVEKDMPAKLCSTGEQKALLMGIVLAGARMERSVMGRAPILLLDEVAAHLDEVRRTALFEELKGLGSQIWLTGTDKDLFHSLRQDAIFFDVSKGTVSLDDI